MITKFDSQKYIICCSLKLNNWAIGSYTYFYIYKLMFNTTPKDYAVKLNLIFFQNKGLSFSK